VDLARAGTRPPVEESRTRALRTRAILGCLAFLSVGVVVAALITSTAPQAATMPRLRPSAITGPAALRPDLIDAQLAGTTPAPPPSAPSASTEQTEADDSESPAGEGDPAPSQQVKPAAAGQIVTTDPRAGGLGVSVEIVRQFYRLLAAEPPAAFAMLDPALSAADPAGFVLSWASTRAVSVERIEAQPDKSVLAVVSVQRQDSTWLRVEQVFRTTDGHPPRIATAELLAAQRK
jgi:hypothetical protein